ncbi:MAG: DJ-1/PfpI family protein [Spirochaetota bacterium]
MNNRPAIILYDQCALSEIMDFLLLFDSVNPSFLVAGKHGDSIRTVEGLLLTVAETISIDAAREHNPVIVAGGDVAAAIDDDTLSEFLREASTQHEAVVGGICNGSWLLARAGLLAGKRCTHTGHASCHAPAEVIATADALFADAEYVENDIVVDGRIVTAKPWARSEFAVQLGYLSGLLQEDQLSAARDYLRGDYTVE